MCRIWSTFENGFMFVFNNTKFCYHEKKSSVFGYILVDKTYGHLHNEVPYDATHPKFQGQFKHLTDQIAYPIWLLTNTLQSLPSFHHDKIYTTRKLCFFLTQKVVTHDTCEAPLCEVDFMTSSLQCAICGVYCGICYIRMMIWHYVMAHAPP